jgi:hypothetical protein
MLTYRSYNTFTRPKWGIYRSLNSPSDLRDETLRFDYFSIYEEPLTGITQNTDNEESFSFKFMGENQAFFQYSLSEPQSVKLELIHLNGQLIHSFQPTALQAAGKHQNKININTIKSGIYFARFSSGNKVFTQKIISK